MFYRDSILNESIFKSKKKEFILDSDLHKRTNEYIKKEIYPKVIKVAKDELATFPNNIKKAYKVIPFTPDVKPDDELGFVYPFIEYNAYKAFPDIKNFRNYNDAIQHSTEFKEIDKYKDKLYDAIYNIIRSDKNIRKSFASPSHEGGQYVLYTYMKK